MTKGGRWQRQNPECRTQQYPTSTFPGGPWRVVKLHLVNGQGYHTDVLPCAVNQSIRPTAPRRRLRGPARGCHLASCLCPQCCLCLSRCTLLLEFGTRTLRSTHGSASPSQPRMPCTVSRYDATTASAAPVACMSFFRRLAQQAPLCR